MKLKKFSLINGGRGGIVIEADEYLASGNNHQIIDDVKRTRKLPLSYDLLTEVDGLKYYFLVLTGHWIDSYNKYYDSELKMPKPFGDEEASKVHAILKSLWDRTTITGAAADYKGFTLKGTVSVIDKKPVKISTPKITDEDDFGFYEECLTVLDVIAEGVCGYIKEHQLSLDDARQSLVIEGADDKTEDEITQEVIKKLEASGAIILLNEDMAPDALEENNGTTVHNSGSLDKDNLQEAADVEEPIIEEQPEHSVESEDDNVVEADEAGVDDLVQEYEPEEEPLIIPENKGETFGAPAATIPDGLDSASTNKQEDW